MSEKGDGYWLIQKKSIFLYKPQLQMDLNTFWKADMMALTSCKYFVLNRRDNFMSARATGTLASALVSAAIS
jgi:hypothetical protein